MSKQLYQNAGDCEIVPQLPLPGLVSVVDQRWLGTVRRQRYLTDPSSCGSSMFPHIQTII